MDSRKRQPSSSSTGSLVFWSSSFPRQAARVLIVEALPPGWSDTCSVLCDALDNFLSLACSLDGPCRIPLLSLYAISRQPECLLPFVQVRGNLARLHSCVEELRSVPGESCIKSAAKGGDLLRQAVLDSMQQFKQYIRHTSTGNQASSNASVEVTVVTSQPGRSLIHHLESGLKEADLVPLRRLLVVQIVGTNDWSLDSHSPEATMTEDSLMLGTEVDLQQVENSVFAMETVFKAWLQEQGGDREHLHLLLPSPSDSPLPVCVKCDMLERLISPALVPSTPSLGVKTESIRDFLPAVKGPGNQSPTPQRLRVIKVLHADGVCESVLYGLPLVIRPTTCWQLDWDEMETNNSLFHALCQTLRNQDLFLLLMVEPDKKSPAGGSGVCSHYVLQPSPSVSLLLKPVASRELLLPCSLPVSNQNPSPNAMQSIQSCLSQLDEDFVLNPLLLSSNLYQHLRSRALLSQPRYPYRLQSAAAHREQQPQAAESSRNTGGRQQRQPPNRQPGPSSRVRATVAPLPSASPCSSSLLGPPPAKASRPALHFLSSGRRAPAPPLQEDDGGDDCLILQ
ncbi:meiosis 1 arrest protein [Poecilia reticulata]|uniref:meiosis 1 arrest protein n=1 Tax=Poecilia reticulata TaxID=8081 RepID=UPI0004A38CD6|nr:PREDICTED: meiosis 1 arrest protein [Poecilia reticulata]XP_008434169.1 PREDICTED: meiosis 1 arrest protein [Poecilia reticulata]XP_008434171.1 PREDICTED: meiosis 1 arrest protein [Poecilia reticulata]XP_008434172.1 PREDICTED: meiosis 1 arrest protein [Poecilia reticulata]XP_008434173.1 PREDICTED: meiosis 1 arrest protein [Poecilia reticulata]